MIRRIEYRVVKHADVGRLVYRHGRAMGRRRQLEEALIFANQFADREARVSLYAPKVTIQSDVVDRMWPLLQMKKPAF
jgi:hypothetical protein